MSVRNHGPFLEESAIVMEAAGCDEHPYNRVGAAPVRNGVLTSAALFGPSGSGRSSFVTAAGVMKELVLGHHTGPYPFYDPFMSSGGATSMKLCAVVGRERYEYSVSFDKDSVLSETLYSFPSGRRRLVFDRRTGRGTDPAILEGLPASSSYLSAASSAGVRECTDMTAELSFYDTMSQHTDPVANAVRYMDTDPGLADRVAAMMAELDTGVTRIARTDSEAALVLTHPLTGGGGKAFPISQEAYGIQQTVALLSSVLTVLEKGGTLFVDSLGNGMHPEVTRCIVELFSLPENTNNAQLIASTDDLSLMDIRDLFRRDQIWFSDIDRREGLAELYSLFDFKSVRRDSDVLGMYLSGKLGALPEVGRRGRLPPV